MIDRIQVILDQPTEDVQPLLEALQLLKGVKAVVPVEFLPQDFVAYSRIRSELIKQLHDVLSPRFP